MYIVDSGGRGQFVYSFKVLVCNAYDEGQAHCNKQMRRILG